MYLFHPHSVSPLQPLVIPSPSSSAGLYVKTRSGRTVKASIPWVISVHVLFALIEKSLRSLRARSANCLAFQTGETLSLLSSHRLAATPHFVNGNTTSIGDAALKVILAKKRDDPSWSDVQSGSISRETLAVFLQVSPFYTRLASSNLTEVITREHSRIMKKLWGRKMEKRSDNLVIEYRNGIIQVDI